MTDALEIKRKKSGIWRKALLCFLAAALLLTLVACGEEVGEQLHILTGEGEAEAHLRQQLADPDVKEITIKGNLYLTAPVEVSGSKTIKGDGKIKAIGEWDSEEAAYLLQLRSGAEIILAESLTVDANGLAGGIYVADGAVLHITEEAVVREAAEGTANVLNAGAFLMEGGYLQDAKGNNLHVATEAVISGGEITGSGKGFYGVYVEGSLEQSGGVISGAYHNVYVAGNASFVWNSGSNLDSVENGITVAEGGTLQVTSAEAVMKNAGAQGIQLEGTAVIDDISMSASKQNQIKVEKNAELTLNNGMIDAGLGHGVTNRGKMTMNGGYITKSESCGIVNTGELEITGGRIANNANKGVLVKNGGNLVIASKDVSISANRIGVAVEENAYADVSLAAINSNTLNNISCFGEIFLHDIMMGGSGSNCIATNYGGHVIAKNLEIISTNGNNGIYNINGSLVELTDVIITSTKTAAIRSLDADLVGTNVTIRNCGNGISTGDYIYGEAGSVKITNLTMEGVKGSNVATEAYCAGTIELINATLGATGSNNMSIKGGHVILNNVDILGNDPDATTTIHGILMDDGGKITATDVTIDGAKVSAIRNRGGIFEGTNVTICNAGQDGISNASHGTSGVGGKVTIYGLYTYGMGQNNIDNNSKGGTVSIIGGTLGQTVNNNVANYNGTTYLSGVTVNGTIEKYSDYLYGFMITGGTVVAEDVVVGPCYAAAVRTKGGDFIGTNVTTKGGIFFTWNSGGNVTVDGLVTENVTKNNIQIDADDASVNITNGKLCGTINNNIRIFKGVVSLKDTDVTGHSPEANEEVHAVMMTGGELKVDNVVIHDSLRCGIRNKGGVVTGKNLTLKDIGTSGISNTLEGKVPGVVTLDGLVTENVGGENILADAGTITLTNSTLGLSGNNNVSIKGADLVMTDSKVLGTRKTNDSNIHGIMVTKGSAKLENVEINDVDAAAVRVTNGKVVGTNISANGGTWFTWTSGGSLTVNGLTTNGMSGENLSVDGGTVTVSNASLGVCGSNSVAAKGGVTYLSDSQILGTSKGGAHGVYVTKGKAYVTNVTIDGTHSGLRVNNAAAVLEATDVTMTNLREHGINQSSGTTTLTNVTIGNAADKCAGINVTGGTVTGENVTIDGAVNYGINLGKNAGDITITGLSINAPDAEGNQSVQANTNLQVENGYAGTITLQGTADKDAVFGVTKTNGIRTYSGKLVLNHVDILGTVKDNAICTTASGVVIANDLEIRNAKGSALRFKDTASFTGTDVVVENCGSGAYLHGSGSHSFTGLTVSGSTGSNITQDSGFSGAVILTGTADKPVSLGASASHNIRLYGGTLDMTYVDIAGTTASGIHGILSDGAVITANNVTIHDTAGSGLRLRANTAFTGTNVSLNNIGADGISNAGGTTDITGLQITNAAGYGIDNGDTLILRGTDNSISGCGSNAIHNYSGKTVTVESAAVTGSISNEGTMTLTTGTVTGKVENTGALTIGKVYVSDEVYTANAINYAGTETAHSAEDPMLITVPEENIKPGTVLVTFDNADTAQALANSFAVPESYEEMVGTSVYHDGILEVYDNTLRLFRDPNVYIAVVNGSVKYKTLEEAVAYAATVSNAETSATIQLIDDAYVGATISIPEGANIIITDDGTARTIKRDSTGSWDPAARGVLVDVESGATLTLQGTGTDTLIVDGNKASLSATNANWTLIDDFGTVNIGAGVVLQNNKSTGAGAAIRVESGANLNVTGGKVLNNETAGNHGGAIYIVSGAKDISIQHAAFEGNTSGQHGGAICAPSGAAYDRLYINDCIFTGNQSGKDSTENAYGGAISTYGPATIENSTFTGNSGTHGGAINGGNNSNITITGCTFTGNSSSQTGGAVNGAGSATLNVSGCTFTGNTAAGNGGAVSMAKGTITGSTFTGNSTTASGGAINSTASNAANLVVTNCTVTGNTAKTGGGVYAPGKNYLTLDGCTVTGNTSTSNQGHDVQMAGTATNLVVKTSSQPAVLDLYFRNTCTLDIEGVLLDGSQLTCNWMVDMNRIPAKAVTFDSADAAKTNRQFIKLVDSLQETYHLEYTDGTDYRDYATLETGKQIDVAIVNGEYYSDFAAAMTAAGEASVASGEVVTVKLLESVQTSATIAIPSGANIIITDDGETRTISRSADFSGRGVMFDLINGNSSLEFVSTSGSNDDCKLIIDGNNKSSHSGNWAVVVVRETSTLTVNSGVKFTNNYSGGAGAVIRVENYNGAKLIANGGVFEGNTSDGNTGGAINFLCTSTVSVVKNVVFKNNTSTYGGAVIIQKGVTAEFENCSFIGNVATAAQGAICSDGNAIVTNCQFTDNVSTGDGGAMGVGGSATVTNSTFTGNQGKNSGAIHVGKNGKATIEGGTFTGNQATNGYGGAISAWGGTLNVTGATFTGNSATASGGAVLGYKGGASIVNLTDCTFTENTAAVQGGALAAWESMNTVVNCTFTNNSATAGGAIHLNNQATSKLVVTGGTFTGNKANNGAGGAICASAKNPQVEISGASFSKNTASGDGGAICASATVGVKVSDCTFTENSANQGGAITIPTGSYLILHNVICSGNTANAQGNDIRLGGATSKLTMSGKIVTAVYNRNKSTNVITGALAEGSSIAFDWYVDATDDRIPDIAVQFDSEADAAASMPYITVGETCINNGYALKQDGAGAVLYQSAATAALSLEAEEAAEPVTEPVEEATEPATEPVGEVKEEQ